MILGTENCIISMWKKPITTKFKNNTSFSFRIPLHKHSPFCMVLTFVFDENETIERWGIPSTDDVIFCFWHHNLSYRKLK